MCVCVFCYRSCLPELQALSGGSCLHCCIQNLPADLPQLDHCPPPAHGLLLGSSDAVHPAHVTVRANRRICSRWCVMCPEANLARFTSPCSLVSPYSAHDNDVKEANKSKSSPSAGQSLQPQTHVPLSPAAPSLHRQPTSSSQQLLLQASSYPQLSQHSPALSQLHMLADCQTLGPVGSREYLQPHQAGLLSASMPASSFASFPSLASGLRGLPLQGPISMQVSMGPERHCLGLTYGSGYLSSHHSFTASCFDR